MESEPSKLHAGAYLADGPVFVFDAQGRCLWVNRQGELALNSRSGLIVGRYVFDLFPEDSRIQTDAWRRVIETGESSSFLSEAGLSEPNEDGERPFQITLHPVMGAGGTVQSVVSVGRRLVDTEVLLHRNQMQAAELSLVHDIASIMTSSLDIEEVYERFASEFKKLIDFERILVAKVDEANNTATHTFVSSSEQLTMDPVDPLPLAGSGIEWAVKNRRTNVEGDLSRKREFPRDDGLADRGVRSIMRVPMVTRSGLVGVLSLSSSHPDVFGEREQAIAEHVARQIAPAFENANLYEEVHQALESLRSTQERTVRVERLSAMGELANGVAHDFNNSLVAILAQTQLLMRQSSLEPHLKSLRMIERAATDSAQAVKKILDFVKFDSDAEFSAVDVNRIVDDAVDLTRHKRDEAQSTGNDIRVEVHAGDVRPVFGSYTGLREVMTNLLFNAYEAISRDGSIDISTRSADGLVHVSVVDTGIGMSDETVQRVFEPYFTNNDRDGAGLGLSVAYGIVTRHEGTIDVDSEEGRGTTVSISLPCASTSEEPVAPEASDAGKSSTGARILVVEDEPLIRETMADVLLIDGHEVTLASDGEEGLRLFKRDGHDMVFTDLSMPGLSGWQVAEEIKRHRSDVPVVMVTGWGVLIDESEMEAAGVDGVLAKPFAIEAVLGLVRDLLGADRGATEPVPDQSGGMIDHAGEGRPLV
jgi:signal transduction histidine kinase/ActR/RegA family two-component response regulator